MKIAWLHLTSLGWEISLKHNLRRFARHSGTIQGLSQRRLEEIGHLPSSNHPMESLELN